MAKNSLIKFKCWGNSGIVRRLYRFIQDFGVKGQRKIFTFLSIYGDSGSD